MDKRGLKVYFSITTIFVFSFIIFFIPAVHASLTDGLVGYWKFDEGSGNVAHDSSGNGNDGTLVYFPSDNSQWVAGQMNWTLNFDLGTIIRINKYNLIPGTMSICMWADARSYGNAGPTRIIDDGRFIFGLYGSTGSFSFTSNNGGNWANSGSGSFTFNKWYHVCITRTAAGIVNFYVNGSLKGTSNQNSGTPVDGVRNVGIGGKSDAASNGVTGWDGYLDDVRIYNRVLDSAEISELYNQGINNPSAVTPPADVSPPIISEVMASNLLETEATIFWKTNEQSNSQIEYGASVSYGSQTAIDLTPVTSHFQTLSSLTAGTAYHYRVKSKDTSGNLAISPDYTFTTKAAVIISSAEYILSLGSFSVENLGSPIQSSVQERQNMFRMQNGQTHLILYYVPYTYTQNIFQILDLNLEAGTYKLAEGVLGRPGVKTTVFHPNGKMYHTSMGPAYAFEYDPQTATVRQLGQLSDWNTEVAEIGDDNAVYFGTCCHGKAVRYDPATDILEDFGRMDENPQTDYETNYQYTYTIGADTRYIYAGLGENPWYLGVYDRKTKQKTIYWRDNNDTGGEILHGKSGGWYYKRNNPSFGSKWYKLENGTPMEIPASQVPEVYYSWQYGGNVGRDFTKFPIQFGYEIDLAYATPDSGSGSRAIIKWRRTGASDWQSASVSGLRLSPAQIKRAYNLGNNKLLGTTEFYGPFFQYDISTKEVNTLGLPQYSLYNTLFYDNNNIFFSGYPAAVIRYDPTKPWTLTSSIVDKFSPSVNPYNINANFGKYDHYLVKGSDGLVYIGGHHERDSTGGELGWYNPITNAKGSLREPLLKYDVADLISVEDGKKIVFSGKGIETGLDGKLFVVDVGTKQIVKIITPWPGATAPAPGKIVEVEPSIILGVIAQTGATYIYKLNIDTGEIIFTKNFPETAFGIRPAYDDRIVKALDGYVWFEIGNNIVRVNPQDGTVEKILLNQTGNPLFINKTDLYIYNGLENLYRVKNILIKNPSYSGPESSDMNPVIINMTNNISSPTNNSQTTNLSAQTSNGGSSGGGASSQDSSNTSNINKTSSTSSDQSSSQTNNNKNSFLDSAKDILSLNRDKDSNLPPEQRLENSKTRSIKQIGILLICVIVLMILWCIRILLKYYKTIKKENLAQLPAHQV